ncbi:uncharacterized protein [Diadema antillarum]|uniref:uncharacterized protein n=1 Tax=Diadema antillarum TaxID=105358 RepID=UPI003A857FAB
MDRLDNYKLNYIEVEIGPPKPRYLENGEPLPLIKVAPGGGKVKYSTIVFPDKDKENKGSDKKSKDDSTTTSHSSSSSSSSADRRSSNSGRGIIKGFTLAQKTAAITKTLSGLTSKLNLSSSSSSSKSVETTTSTSTSPTLSSSPSTVPAVSAAVVLSQPPNRPPPVPDLGDTASKVRPSPVGEESAGQDVTLSGKGCGAMPCGSVSATGNGSGRAHTRLERKESYKNAKQHVVQQQNSKTPPASPPRRRALSTPTRSRKFPSEAELADAIKAHQERRESPPSKTRTLPAREKLWREDELEVEEGFWDYDDVVAEGCWMSAEGQHDDSSFEDIGLMMRSAPATELAQAMRAMQMKVKRKSSTGEAYDNVFEPPCSPTTTAKSGHFFGCGDSGSGSGTESPRCETSSPSKQSSSPVSKRLPRSELEQAFARRKLTGRFHSEQYDFDNLSSGSNSPTRFDDVYASGYRPVPAVPSSRNRDYSGSPESPSYLDMEYRGSVSTRKPVPLPRNNRCRESASESCTLESVFNLRPVPSPPAYFNQSFDYLSGARDSSGDETYMNVAFKPKGDSHRYENVVLDDRLSGFHSERPLSSSDSPRASTELRPVPAPRFYSSPCSSSHSLSSLDGSNQLASPGGKQNSQAGCGASPLSAPNQPSSGRGSPNHQHGRNAQQTQKLVTHGNAASSAQSNLALITGCTQGATIEKPPRTGLSACPQERGVTGGCGGGSAHSQLSRNASSHPGHYSREASVGATKQEGRKEVRTMSNGHATKEMRNSSLSQSKESWQSTERCGNSGQQTKDGRTSHHNPLVQTNSIGMDGASLGGAQGGVGGATAAVAAASAVSSGGATAGGGGTHFKAPSVHGNNGSRPARGANCKDQILPSHVTQPWYYGRMLRQECEYLMLSQGISRQYLVRDSSHRAGDLMLSVLYGSKVHHYVIQTTEDKKFQIAHHDFDSVEAILDFYHKHVIMYSTHQEPVYLGDPFIFRRR